MSTIDQLRRIEGDIKSINLRLNNVRQGGAAGLNHNILDGSVHSDSVADAVTRGSIIYGNATPKWDELVLGAADTFLGSDGNDLSYRTAAQVLASLSAEAAAAFDWNAQNLTNIGTLSADGITDISTIVTNIAAGTTGQRPAGVVGDIRYNSTLGRYEFYDGAWENVLLSGNVGIADDDILSVDLVGGLIAGDIVRATAAGLESRTDAQILAQLSGDAVAAFDWNGQNLTNLGTGHDAFSDFVSDEHVAHSGVTLTAGEGLSGGGDISANRTFNLDINGLVEDAAGASGDFFVYYDTVAGDYKKIDWDDMPGGGGGAPTDAEYVVLALDATLTAERVLTAGTGISLADGGAGGNATLSTNDGAIDHDSLLNYVANEHIDYTSAIDNTNYVTKTALAFRAYRSSTQANIVDNTHTRINCDTEDFDGGSDYDNTATNYHWTVPVNGRYLLYFSVKWSGCDAAEYYEAGIYAGSVAGGNQVVKNAQAAISQAGRLQAQCTGYIELDLTSGTEYFLGCYHNDGANTADIVSGSDTTYWGARLVSTA